MAGAQGALSRQCRSSGSGRFLRLRRNPMAHCLTCAELLPDIYGRTSGAVEGVRRCVCRWSGQKWRDKLAAGFTVPGTPSGNKFNTLQYFHTLAMQHGMIWVGLGEPPSQPNGVNRLGSWLGAMAQALDGGSGIVPEDRLTGEALGKRVANFVSRMK